MMDWGGLIDGARLFLVLFARVAALLRTAPITSSSAIPPIARGVLSFFTAILFYYFIGNSYGAIPDSGLGYAIVLVAEVLLGIIMGLFLQIIFAIFQTAGQLFSVQMGFGASQVFDPLAQIEIPLIGQFLNLVGLAVFLSMDGMLKIFLSGLSGSFAVMKGTDFLAAGPHLRVTFIGAIAALFEQALILAFPILGSLILVSVTMGLLAKAAPQMNLLLVGFPIQISVGFLLMLLAAPFMIEKMSYLIDMGFNMISNYLLATSGALP